MASYELMPHERDARFQKELAEAKAELATERADLRSAKTRRELVELFAVNPSIHDNPVGLAQKAFLFIAGD